MADGKISKIQVPIGAENKTYEIKDSSALSKAGDTATGKITFNKGINVAATNASTKQDKIAVINGSGDVQYRTVAQVKEDLEVPTNLRNGSALNSLTTVSATPPDSGSYTIGEAAMTIGEYTYASGKGSFAEGSNTHAQGVNTHAEGVNTYANGDFSHAEGVYSDSTGEASHAEGAFTKASRDYSHAEGAYNIIDTDKKYLHILGNGTSAARSNAHTIDGSGNGWFKGTLKLGGTSQDDVSAKTVATTDQIPTQASQVGALPASTKIPTQASDVHARPDTWMPSAADVGALPVSAKIPTQASDIGALPDSTPIPSNLMNGSKSGSLRNILSKPEDASYTIGVGSVAIGIDTSASGSYSYTEGKNTTASGNSSHAEGYGTTASGDQSHTEGHSTTASGDQSHTEGYSTTASGWASHAEGYGTKASKAYAHAEGDNTTASGDYTHAEGKFTEASRDGSHAEGTYNIIDTNKKYLHILGNGTSNARSNAHTIDGSGNGWFKGALKIGGTGQDDVTAKTVATTDQIPAASKISEWDKKANVVMVTFTDVIDNSNAELSWYEATPSKGYYEIEQLAGIGNVVYAKWPLDDGEAIIPLRGFYGEAYGAIFEKTYFSYVRDQDNVAVKSLIIQVMPGMSAEIYLIDQDLSGYATTDQIPTQASDVHARPDTWMPSAADVHARPDTWMPTASQVGALPAGTKIPTQASDVHARPDDWMPTASQVGALGVNDISSWAKASNKPTYNASEIGTGTFANKVSVASTAQPANEKVLRNIKLMTAAEYDAVSDWSTQLAEGEIVFRCEEVGQ